MMKKILFAAAALVAFAACTNDDVVSRLEGPAIAFDNAFVENTTRVAQDLSKANLNNFGVYGSVENASGLGMIFTNTTVTKNGDAYTYSPAQYWVGDATYNFTAFAPAADQKWAYNTLDAKNGVVTFDNEAAAGKQDFLFASANETTPSAITSAPAPVAFTFNHMLSRVKFSFTNGFAAGSNIALKVTDVKITNAHKSGDLKVVNGVAQEWVVADNAVATNAFERPFGLEAVFLRAVGVFHPVDGLQEHAQGAHPKAAVPVELAVDDHGLAGFGVGGDVLDQVVVALEMAVDAVKFNVAQRPTLLIARPMSGRKSAVILNPINTR